MQSYNPRHNVLEFELFKYRSDLPQVKRNFVCSITNLVQELPYELLNDLRFRIFRNSGNIRNISNLGGDIA